MLDVESRVSLQSIDEPEVYLPCTMEHQNVFKYDENSNQVPICGTDEMEVIDGEDSPTFLDISNNMKHSPYTEIKAEPDTDTLMSWTQKHPEHWSQNEILDWIFFVADTIDVDPTTIRGEGFQNITGPELCRMTQADFQKRDPVNGKCFYDMFRSLHKDAFFCEPPPTDYEYVYHQTEIKQEVKEETPCPYSSTQNKTEEENLYTTIKGSDMEVLIGTAWYDIDPCVEIPPEDLEQMARHILASESDYDSESHSDSSETMDKMCNRMYRTDSTGSDVISDDEISQHSSESDDNELINMQWTKTETKRKLTKHGDKQKAKCRGRKPGQISKGNHLWEFIRDLLRDPNCNPEILKWEEKETGVFRFVRSEAVAILWGKKKNNRGMTYEKLSRAMRFCRTAGYFAQVPKTGKFPKKLCFRFGAKAFGWKD